MEDDNIEILSATESKLEEVAQSQGAELTKEEPKEAAVDESVTEPIEEQDTSGAVDESEELEDAAEIETEIETEEQKADKRNGFERQKLKWQHKLQAKEQEAELLRQELQRARQGNPVTTNTPPVMPTHEPDINNYSDIKEYTRDLTAFQFRQMQAQQDRMKTVNEFQARQDEFKKITPDFEEAIADAADAPASQEVQTFLVESTVGPAIQYYLSKNLNELSRINALPPHRAFAELGKLEDRFAVKKQQTPPTKKSSAAPPPIKPATGSAPALSKSVYEMNTDEVLDYLEQQEKAARKAGRRVR